MGVLGVWCSALGARRRERGWFMAVIGRAGGYGRTVGKAV
jgi:hypothetical protein